MISKKYKELYVGTAQRQLQQLVSFLLSLEKRPNSKSLIENIFRLVHSMKGQLRSKQEWRPWMK